MKPTVMTIARTVNMPKGMNELIVEFAPVICAPMNIMAIEAVASLLKNGRLHWFKVYGLFIKMNSVSSMKIEPTAIWAFRPGLRKTRRAEVASLYIEDIA